MRLFGSGSDGVGSELGAASGCGIGFRAGVLSLAGLLVSWNVRGADVLGCALSTAGATG